MIPTYKEQERHLHEEYIAGKIDPYDNESCICGNMLGERPIYRPNRSSSWPEVTYYPDELAAIETALLGTILDYVPYKPEKMSLMHVMKHPNFEEGIYHGLVAGLKVLKTIHRERFGENIDEGIYFPQKEMV